MFRIYFLSIFALERRDIPNLLSGKRILATFLCFRYKLLPLSEKIENLVLCKSKIEMDKLKVFTAFSGYDSQCMALDRLGVDYELVLKPIKEE